MTIIVNYLFLGSFFIFLLSLGVKGFFQIKKQNSETNWDWLLLLAVFFQVFGDLSNFNDVPFLERLFPNFLSSIPSLILNLMRWTFSIIALTCCLFYILKSNNHLVKHKKLLVILMILWSVSIFQGVLLLLAYLLDLEFFYSYSSDSIYYLLQDFLQFSIIFGFILTIDFHKLKSWLLYGGLIFIISSPLEWVYFKLNYIGYISSISLFNSNLHTIILYVDKLLGVLCVCILILLSEISKPSDLKDQVQGNVEYSKSFNHTQLQKAKVSFFMFLFVPILFNGIQVILSMFGYDIFSSSLSFADFLAILIIVAIFNEVSLGIQYSLLAGLVFPLLPELSGKTTRIRESAKQYEVAVIITFLLGIGCYMIVYSEVVNSMELIVFLLLVIRGLIIYVYFRLHNVFKDVHSQFVFSPGFTRLKISVVLMSVIPFLIITSQFIWLGFLILLVLIGIVLYFVGLITIILEINSVLNEESAKMLQQNTTLSKIEIHSAPIQQMHDSELHYAIQPEKAINKDNSHPVDAIPIDHHREGQTKSPSKDLGEIWENSGISEGEIQAKLSEFKELHLSQSEKINQLIEWLDSTSKNRGYPLSYPKIFRKAREMVFKKGES